MAAEKRAGRYEKLMGRLAMSAMKSNGWAWKDTNRHEKPSRQHKQQNKTGNEK